MSLRLPALVLGVILLTACSSSSPEPTASQRPAPPTTTAGPPPVTTPSAAPPAAPTAAAPTATTPTPTTPTATVTIQGFAYVVPASVAPGEALDLVNRDGEAHTFTIKGSPPVVVPGRGTATAKAPARAGTYTVVCDFHGGMTAQLVVA